MGKSMPPERLGVPRRKLAVFGARRLFPEETRSRGIEVGSTDWAHRISSDVAPDSDGNDNCNSYESYPESETMHTEPPLHTI
jgi:hypothetical protein